jgi:hypothetical protein
MRQGFGCAVLAGVLAVCAATNGRCADEPVTITTFELVGGAKLEGFQFSTYGNGDQKNYVVSLLDGRKQILLEKEIAARREEIVALEKLSASVREEVLRSRAAAAAARAEAEAAAADQQRVDAARRRENEARERLAKVSAEIEPARTVLSAAETILSGTPVEIAKAEARYDAAKTELAATGNCSFCAYGNCAIRHRSAETLTEMMTLAAEDKVKAAQAGKAAEGVISRSQDTLRQLDERLVAARKEYDAARAETRSAAAQADAAAAQRRKAREAQAQPAANAAAAKSPVTVLTLKDKTVIRAVTILQDPDGRLSVKDEQGQVRYLSPEQIEKRELQAGK